MARPQCLSQAHSSILKNLLLRQVRTHDFLPVLSSVFPKDVYIKAYSNFGHRSISIQRPRASKTEPPSQATWKVEDSSLDAAPKSSGIPDAAASTRGNSRPDGASTSGRNATTAPKCPGCGVRMQNVNPSLPGYYKPPKQQSRDISKLVVSEEELARLKAEGLAVIDEGQEASRGKRKRSNKRSLLQEDEDSDAEEEIPEGWQTFVLPKKGSRSAAQVLPAEAASKLEDELQEADLDPELEEQLKEWDKIWDEDFGDEEDVEAGKRVLVEGEGEVERERAVVCARCHALKHSGKVKDSSLENLLPDFDFERVVGRRLRQTYGRRAVVLMVVDASDFDGSFPRRAAQVLNEVFEVNKEKAGGAPKVLLVANKIDLLPKTVAPIRLENWLRRRARAGGAPYLSGVHVVSSLRTFGIGQLSNHIASLCGERGEVWVIGAQNAGKSSLINALGKINRSKRPELTASAVPGTTIGVLQLEKVLPGRLRLFDTPGLLHPHQITTRLTADEMLLLQPRKELKPRTYRIRAGQALHIGGLGRIDALTLPTATSYLTVWASPEITTHLGSQERADELKDAHFGGLLQPPIGDQERVDALGQWQPRTVTITGESWDRSSKDIAFAGLGWVGVGLKGEAEFRIWTWEGVGLSVRDAMVLDFARELSRPGFQSMKLAYGQARAGLPAGMEGESDSEGQKGRKEKKEGARS